MSDDSKPKQSTTQAKQNAEFVNEALSHKQRSQGLKQQQKQFKLGRLIKITFNYRKPTNAEWFELVVCLFLIGFLGILIYLGL